METTIEILGEEAGCEPVRPLPTLRLLKSTADGVEQHSGEEGHGDAYVPLTPGEMECVRLLQRELPLQPRPFDGLAKNTNTTAEELLAAAKTLLGRGQMRRFGAVIQMRRPGFSATASGVWVVPPARTQESSTPISPNP